MLKINDKTVRDGLIEKYMKGETNPEEERLLTDFFRNASELDADEDAVRLLLLATESECPSKDVLFAAEKEAEFDAIVAQSGKRSMRRRATLFAAFSGVAAAVVGAVALFLLPEDKRTPASCRITEVTDDSVYTKSEIRLALQKDSASGKRKKMLNVCDFYEMAVALFPDCDQISLEMKGDVIMLTAIQNDSTKGYYIISLDNPSRQEYQITELLIGK